MLNDSLPYGNAKLYLGIASVVFSPILLGFVLGVISVYLVDKDTKMLNSNPGAYSDLAKSKHKTGSIAAWIGFALSLALTIAVIYLFGTYGTLSLEKINALRGQ